MEEKVEKLKKKNQKLIDSLDKDINDCSNPEYINILEDVNSFEQEI